MGECTARLAIYVTTHAIGSSSIRVPLPALAGLNHAGSSGFGSAAAAASAGSRHSFGGQVASRFEGAVVRARVRGREDLAHGDGAEGAARGEARAQLGGRQLGRGRSCGAAAPHASCAAPTAVRTTETT